MTDREERRKRGEEKRTKYSGELLAVADEAVKAKVSQQVFHERVTDKRAALEKACPQEKLLIAEAVNTIAAKLSEMEAGLVSKPVARRPAADDDRRRPRNPRSASEDRRRDSGRR